MTSKTQHIDFANKLLHNVHKYKSEKDWSHLLIPKKYNVSGHSAVFQKSMVDQNETLLQKPFPLFSEEVNAHLEQLNETVYYNDPVLVAFTLTTDVFIFRSAHLFYAVRASVPQQTVWQALL